MINMNTSLLPISHEDIYNYPFPYKLWIAVNSASCDFIKWNIDGTQIEVHLMALDNYLNRPKCIFKTKSRSSFITHLREYSFQLVKTEEKKSKTANSSKEGEATVPAESSGASKYSEIVMHFCNSYFLRHRIDLLANIRQTNEKVAPLASTGNQNEQEKNSFMKSNSVEDDLCFRRLGYSSQLSRAHFKHQLILNFLSETNNLETKLKASDMKSITKENDGNDEDSMIELSVELFENPHDSVLYMGEEHRTSYAGFYGTCSNEQVLKFFGSYLPMYENEDNNEEGEKRIANSVAIDKTIISQPKSIEINFIINDEHTQSSENDTQQNESLTASTSVCLQPQNVSLPSSLEPIFTSDEEILMDEFIKFKEETENEDLNKSIEETKVKIEGVSSSQKENEGNEDNFRSFFSQYRESLSLLYEKQ